MTNNALVSIILPSYNHALFLKERIDSILNQTYQNFELIILDDYSTDNSRDIIKGYENSKYVISIVLNKKKSGSTFIQWEKGFSLAKGEYIWVAESDDVADPIFLETMVSLLESNKDSKIAYCHSYLIDENSEVLPEKWIRNNGNIPLVSVFDGSFFIKSHMLIDNSIYNASMAVFRRKALDNIDKDYINFKYCGDWCFWNNIYIQGNVIRYRDRLNFFRQHSNKVTTKADSIGLKFMEGKYIVDDIIKSFKLNYLQKVVLLGYYLRSIVRFEHFKNEDVKSGVLIDVKTFFKAHMFYINLFRIDRSLNFSKLDIKKNRYI